jgi:hypothetical protein
MNPGGSRPARADNGFRGVVMMRSRAMTSRTLPAIVVQQGSGWQDWVTVRYRSSDPYAVEAVLPGRDARTHTWVFARELLAAGLVGSVGQGDVRISPWPATADTRGTVRLALRSPSADLLVQLDAADLEEFLAASRTVVLPGNESAHLDLDAAWRRWVA